MTPTTQSYRFDGTMTAVSSITHFGDSVGGTEQVLRREKIFQPDGTYEEVPIISGNSWRGQLRDCGMRAMLDDLARALNLPNLTLSPPAFYLLFSGGALTKDSGRGLDMDMARKLRSLIPLLSVFSGAVGRQIMEGKLTIGKIIPICRETAHIIPVALRDHPHAQTSIYDHLSIEHYTRMDDAKRETLAGRYLPPAAQTLMEAPKIKAVTNKRTGETEDVAEAPGVAQQMRYGFETFAAGTVFACSVSLRYVSDLEFESMIMALRAWSEHPVIGGRSASGMGLVELQFPGWAAVQPLWREAQPSTEVGQPFGAVYREHLATRGPEIRAALEAIA